MGKFIDLTGQKFGRLTAIKCIQKSTSFGDRTLWEFLCDCGKTKILHSGDVKNGGTVSCGCKRKKEFGLSTRKKFLYQLKTNAYSRNLKYELSDDYAIALSQENCFYCGINPKQKIKSESENGDYIYNGIDRIDSSIGYTIENCVPCCGRCNEAKMAESQSGFFEWIKKVYNHLSEKGEI